MDTVYTAAKERLPPFIPWNLFAYLDHHCQQVGDHQRVKVPQILKHRRTQNESKMNNQASVSESIPPGHLCNRLLRQTQNLCQSRVIHSAGNNIRNLF